MSRIENPRASSFMTAHLAGLLIASLILGVRYDFLSQLFLALIFGGGLLQVVYSILRDPDPDQPLFENVPPPAPAFRD